MRNITGYLASLLVMIFCCQYAAAKTVRNKQFKFRISVPATMMEVRDTSKSAEGAIYYDTSAGIVLMLTARDSKFSSIRDYLDCTREELEAQLKLYYGDPALRLISCSRSIYYPDKSTVLSFEVSVLPYGYDTYLIYFFHNRHSDIQISFTFKKDKALYSIDYIDNVMKSFKLKRW
jgi:hypothetical protein